MNLPAVQKSALPVPGARALPPSLVGSVAVLAVGTGIEWLARRMAGSAARAAGRALVGADRPATPAPRPNGDTLTDVTVHEVVYVRKVQLRR